MSEEDLTNYKTYISDLDITKYIVLDNESNYWYSAEYVDKMLKKQDKEIERLKEKLKFEEATNKELLSTGADLENKLYEEQDKNKRLNNIINEFDKWLLGEQMMFYKGSDGETLIGYGETRNKWLELKGSDKYV